MNKIINYVPVSLVSALCGRNKYRPQQQAFGDLFQSYYQNIWEKWKQEALDDVEYKNIVNKIQSNFTVEIDNTLSWKQNYEKLIENKKIKKYIDSLEPELSDSESEEPKTLMEKEKEIRSQIITTEKYKKAITSEIYIEDDNTESEDDEIRKFKTQIIIKDRGTSLEKGTISKLKDVVTQEQVNCGRWFTNDKLTGYLEEPSQYSYRITGKFDALSKKYIYEIKNRVNHFFTPLPVYDVDQLSIYMILHNNKLPGILVEQLNGEVLKNPPLSYNDAKQRWKELKPILEKAIDKYEKIFQNPKKRIDFVNKHLIIK